MTLTCEYFDIQDLVSPEIIATIGERASWTLIRPWVQQIDMIRRLYGSALWVNGNGRNYAGVRPIDCKIGAKKSRHKMLDPYVIAFDFVCNDLEKLETVVRNDSKILGAVRMEDPKFTPTWRHIELSCALCPQNLVIFIP